MSSKLQPVRGTHDILPEEYGGDFGKFSAVQSSARQLATLYGFREMATPIFEQTDVFSRSMGESSDVVTKEMFSFETKGGESVCLRPEFTAGIVRAFISGGMQQYLPLKLFSTGPLFRYERPQKGRQRQFHQVNFEWLGDGSWQADVEIITLAGHLLYLLSGGKGCTLLINTLGDAASRKTYRDALVNYLAPFAAELSEDSKRRLEQNPLRILDSKDAGDRKILENAPKITDYLSAEAKERFDKICNALQSKDVPFFQDVKIEPALVRGLDYYTDTVFEFVANTGELGSQNTVLAGGRYDGLVEHMGGKPTPAIGFAAGVERLLLLVGSENSEKKYDLKLYIIPVGELDNIKERLIFSVSDFMRYAIDGILDEEKLNKTCSVETLWSGNLKKNMERANKQGATHALIIGDDFKIKNMKTGIEKVITLAEMHDNGIINNKKLKEIFGI